MSNAINVLQQFSTLSGILAGFSFAAIIVGVHKGKKPTIWALQLPRSWLQPSAFYSLYSVSSSYRLP